MSANRRLLCAATFLWVFLSDIFLRVEGHAGGIDDGAKAIAFIIIIFAISQMRRQPDGTWSLP